MIIYVDSSTREACYVPEGREPVVVPYKDAPVTNNVGEYRAVLLVLELLRVGGIG